jgi:integrase/recombinase XerD
VSERKTKVSKRHPAKLKLQQHAQAALTQDILPPDIAGLLQQYTLGLKALQRSPRTIPWYLDILTRYFLFLQNENMLRPVDKMGRPELNAYLLHLQSCQRWTKRPPTQKDRSRLSPFTIQDHARAVKAFWGWLAREGYIEKNTLERFPLPSVPKTILRIISPEMFEKLLALIDRSIPRGVQRYLIMLALYDTGSRISELLETLIESVDLNLGCIRVMGKGRRERDIPLSSVTIREIRRYLRDFRPKICPAASPYLFPRTDGEHVTVNCIQQFMRRLAKKAEIDGLKLHPHLLRHTFGTQFIVNGGNVFYLKELMGHASLSTTMKYTHLQSEDLRREHTKFSPVGNLRMGKRTDHIQ